MSQEINQRSLFFRARLRALLGERGITQLQLAIATNLTPQSISNYVRGTRSLPGAEELFALAKFFGVSMDSFLDAGEVEALAGKSDPPSLSPVNRSELRRVAKQVRRNSEELRAHAERLERLANGEADSDQNL